MRKLTRSLLAISFFIFALCGCESDTSVDIQNSFCADAQVVQNDLAFNCVVERQSATDLSVKIKSDDNTDGLKYRYVNDTLYIEYEGMRCIAGADYLKSDCAVSLLYSVMCELENLSSYPCELKENVCVYTLKTERVNALLSIDRKSGRLLFIKFLGSVCTVKFST